MADTTLYLVFSNPVDGMEDEFNQWYDAVHVHEVLAMPGMLTAQRYKLFDAEISRAEGIPAPTHRYLTVYEMEGDVDATMAKITEAYFTGAMSMSEALDVTDAAMSFWSPLGPKVDS
jgi:hypothetical protein